jgi:hypothetical protein
MTRSETSPSGRRAAFDYPGIGISTTGSWTFHIGADDHLMTSRNSNRTIGNWFPLRVTARDGLRRLRGS